MTNLGGRIGRGSILAVTGAAACVLLLGCGGGNDLSKAEFVQQANGICKKGRQETSKILFSAPREDGGVPLIVALLNKEADEIGALDGPSADADQIEAIVSGARKAADMLEAKGDLVKAHAPIAEAEKLAGDYGLDECLLD